MIFWPPSFICPECEGGLTITETYTTPAPIYISPEGMKNREKIIVGYCKECLGLDY